jgi:hypothetical protein
MWYAEYQSVSIRTRLRVRREVAGRDARSGCAGIRGGIVAEYEMCPYRHIANGASEGEMKIEHEELASLGELETLRRTEEVRGPQGAGWDETSSEGWGFR